MLNSEIAYIDENIETDPESLEEISAQLNKILCTPKEIQSNNNC